MSKNAINNNSFLERLFINEYDECLLYCLDLSDENAVEWLETEGVHLLKAAELLDKYERTPWQSLVLPTSAQTKADIIKLLPKNFDRTTKKSVDRAADIFNLMLNGND
ncbi:MAG: hypothetical protein J1G04_05685 [Clostridiales bacterium]|nr:hypothetical protein [Clostridiales bacterium]